MTNNQKLTKLVKDMNKKNGTNFSVKDCNYLDDDFFKREYDQQEFYGKIAAWYESAKMMGGGKPAHGMFKPMMADVYAITKAIIDHCGIKYECDGVNVFVKA